MDDYDGPVYVINKEKIYKYSLASGREVMVELDERSVEYHHSPIMHKRSVIKVHPFSYINQTFTMAYEQVLKMGTSVVVEAGYVNNSLAINSNPYFYSVNGEIPDLRGFFIKPGYKFLLGQDFSLKGMKYAHPLKGRFISLDAVFSYLSYKDVWNSTSYNPTTTISTAEICDVNSMAYGLMINYGRQFILANVMTLEYYIGLGATGQSYERTNFYSEEVPSSYYSVENTTDPEGIYNYRGFYRIPQIGLSAAFGFRLGYILPSREKPKN